jgi:heme exporter protein A
MRLVASDLACIRGGRTVFAGLGFAIDAGQALLVTGPNGAGKSSLLRVVAGLLQAAAGRLALDGGDPELSLGEQAHYLGHLDAVKPSLSVQENLGFWTRFLGGADSAIDPALDTVGLGGITQLPAAYLSAGQRRRLSIGRLIAVQRPLWLLDEPTSALDVAGQAMLAGLMAGHLAGGGMILAAVHGPIGLEGARELRIDPRTSSLAQSAPSPTEPGLARASHQTGGEVGAGSVWDRPTPDPSPQRDREPGRPSSQGHR